MSKIVLEIRRHSPKYRRMPVLSYFLGDSLERALGDSCQVLLEVDGQTVGGPSETNWGSGLSKSDLLDFLDRYRNRPGDTHAEKGIRAGLHHFLFGQGAFDESTKAVLMADLQARERSEFLIRGDSSSLPLIINIPWELTEGIHSTTVRESPLIGTLAGLLLARVIPNTRAELIGEKERLRVLYCISEPPTMVGIRGSEFHRAFEDALKARAGMLSYKAVISANFTPTFNQLKAGIEQTQPHIVIIACHGTTDDGVPQLCFERWHPVASLADALREKGRTFLVILIACDQTHLAEHPAAHSGAVTVMEGGILSVVAMQSSVSSILAKEFIGTTLDWFFQNGSIALSVAEGRKSMAPRARDAETNVDWSFPALFLSENAASYANQLSRVIAAYLPTLDEMLRRIPRPKSYLERPEFDELLLRLLRQDVWGLREVSGGPMTGKSAVVRNACRKALEGAVEMNDMTARPILYVDLSRYIEIPKTARELMEILQKQTAEIQSTAAGVPLLTWAASRGADGEAAELDPTGQLINLIDLNHMILVLDNLNEPDGSFWEDFFERANGLKVSLVLRVADKPSDTSDLEIVPFTLKQTENYMERFASRHYEAAGQWFALTQGLPGLLDLLRRSDGDPEAITLSASSFTQHVPDPQQHILYALANLPNGVDAELASWFVGADWRDMLDLSQKGLLLRESRFGVTSSWFRLPRLLMQSLQNDPEKLDKAAVMLADRFIEQIQSNEKSVDEVLIELSSKPGGIDFLQDLHQTLLNFQYDEVARAVPLLLHKSLFSRGRWYEAYRFWERLLNVTPFENSEAHEWLKLAKAAHILGFASQAMDAINKAEQRKPTKIDEIDVLINRAVITKDLGAIVPVEEVTDYYDRALALLEEAKSGLSETDDVSLAELEERDALTLYNRAIHKRYWLRDIPGALMDIEQAGDGFARLNNSRMKALADCVWVDMLVDWRDDAGKERNWTLMLERLVKANDIFNSIGGAAGDSAFCYYQMARCYRLKPFETPDEFSQNMARARDAYRDASEHAQVAGDVRLKEIAQGHLVEVNWELGEIEAAQASQELDDVIDVLRSYKHDAWSTRAVRDMLRQRALILLQVNPNAVCQAYKDAWLAANIFPLHPAHGKDSWRAARILYEYLEELEKSDQPLELDRVSIMAKDFIEQWVGHDIEPLNRKGWMEEIRQYSAR